MSGLLRESLLLGKVVKLQQEVDTLIQFLREVVRKYQGRKGKYGCGGELFFNICERTLVGLANIDNFDNT